MKWIKLFIYLAGAILLVAALLRFVEAAANAQSLALPEPILTIPIRLSMLIVGALELSGAWVCLFGSRVGFQVGWLAWLATDYLVYRICLYSMHIHPQATCLGSLTDPLRLSHGTLGLTLELMPIYLLVGSYVAASWLLIRNFIPQKAAPVRMFCPSCGGKISFAAQNLGQKIPCPLCRKPLTLRAPENLKMSCSFCKEHIEFPVHSIGQKIPCPHCNMVVTLKEPT